MSISCDWVPNIRLGQIFLGEDINVYVNNLGAILQDEEKGSDDCTSWVSYALPDPDVFIDVENQKVVSITSYRDFIYKNKNLIDMSIIELEDVLGCSADEVGETIFYDDADQKTPYEFFDLGLQVWVSEKRVVSISCLTYEDCEKTCSVQNYHHEISTLSS